MKKVLSISIGSSSRDHTTRRELLGQEIEISRQGTDGDLNKAIARYAQFDGKVDAFGVGGIGFYFQVGQRRYYLRDAKRIRKTIKISKVGDGNGVKSILVNRALGVLEKRLNAEGKTLKGMKALKTGAVDRYTMAEALVNAGCETTFGDFMFGLGLPIPVRRLSTVRVLAAAVLPVLTQLPFAWVYPTGAKQDAEPEDRWGKYYAEADIIAGDFLQIRQFMPPDLSGKIVLTNTTTARNVEMLQKRGLHMLVTSTPRLEGRSFGTNVMEATLLALIDKPQPEITEPDFRDLIARIPLEPNIEVLN